MVASKGESSGRSERQMGAERATVNNATVIRSGSAAAWAVAVRPRSLFVAISPVLVGATLGFERTGAIDLLATLLALGAALLMQVSRRVSHCLMPVNGPRPVPS